VGPAVVGDPPQDGVWILCLGRKDGAARVAVAVRGGPETPNPGTQQGQALGLAESAW